MIRYERTEKRQRLGVLKKIRSIMTVVLSLSMIAGMLYNMGVTHVNAQALENVKTENQVQVIMETSGNSMILWILIIIVLVLMVGGTAIYMKKKKEEWDI